MNIDAYLSRIGLARPPACNLAALTALHRAHLRAIPYENLDIHLGRPVTLGREAIFDKLVTRRRGGWCYEMNGLFGWALAELGFRVTRATGAVMREARGDASAGNHLVLKVELEEGLHLADVGFGDGSLYPIPIRPGTFVANGFAFTLSKLDGKWWRLHNHPRGGAASFDFDLTPADEALFERQCRWLQSADESPFVQNAVVQKHTDEGLAVMRGRVLRRMTPDAVQDTLVASASDYVATLRDVFDLDLPEAAALWPAIRARHAVLFGS